MAELGQVFISNFANTEITVFSDDTIVSFLNENDLRQTIDLGFPISQFSNTQILELSDTTIAEFIEEFSSSVEPTTAIPSPESLTRFLSLDSIASTESFENDHKILNNIVFDAGLSPTTTFGISTLELKLILNSIESETVVSVANVFVSIGPEQILSTEAFGQPSVNNPVHRSLIFKDDKITKLGTNDAVEIASGVTFNPSTDKVLSNSTGVVDLLVDVDGSSFALPLVNEDDSGQLVLRAELDNYLEVANAASLSVDTSNLAANTYVNEQLALKADVTDLDNYLQVANVDQITVDTSNLAQNTYVNTTFTTKTESIASNNAIKNLIDNKLDVANVSAVGLSGDYDDLTNKPDLSIFANTTYVDNEIAGIINSAPTTLDTLNELAAALGDDENFSTTVLSSLGTKASNTYVNTTFTTKTDAAAANNTLVSLIDDRLQVANASATFVTKTEAAAANNTLLSLIQDRIQVANVSTVAVSGEFSDLNGIDVSNLNKGDMLYYDGSNFVKTPTSGPISFYSVSANGSSAFNFDGPGVDSDENNPSLVLRRGHTYIFENLAGSNHPFAIRFEAGGTNLGANNGVTGSQTGTQIFTVPFDLSSQSIVYQCTIHTGAMVGSLHISGPDANNTIEGTYQNLHAQVKQIDTVIDFNKPVMVRTLSGATTFSETNKAEGKSCILKLDLDSNTPTFSANIKWAEDSEPTWGDFRYWVVTFLCDDSTNVFASAAGFTI